MARRIFITVAEVSGDLHAANLIRALRTLDPTIVIQGIGGPRMAAAGAEIVYESVGGAAMSWRGALRAFEVMRLLRETRARFERDKPDLHICVDSSAMNLPFAKMAKSLGVPVLYYIAPQLWASREGRMKQVRTYVDRVACILPFEEEYYRRHDVNATFVGHPLFDELPAERTSTMRTREPHAPPTIGIVSGSRTAEVNANLPPLMGVIDRIAAQFPGARFLFPTTNATDAIVASTLEAHGLATSSRGANDCTFERALDSFDSMIRQCDLVLCKSGTSTLHVAAHGVPMIVVYRVSRLLWYFLGRWIIKTRKIALVNILAGNVDLVPEFIPWFGQIDPVANVAIDWLRNPRTLEEQRAKLLNLIRTLDKTGASMNAARIAMEVMGV